MSTKSGFKETDKPRIPYHEAPLVVAIEKPHFINPAGVRLGDDHNVQIWNVEGSDGLFFAFETPTTDEKVSRLAFVLTRQVAEALHQVLSVKLSNDGSADEALARIAEMEESKDKLLEEYKYLEIQNENGRQQLAQSEQRATAAEEKLRTEQEETGEAWEILAASFPTIQVDCDDQLIAARFICETYEAALARATVAEGRVRELEECGELHGLYGYISSADTLLLPNANIKSWVEGLQSMAEMARAALRPSPGDRQDVPAREGEG